MITHLELRLFCLGNCEVHGVKLNNEGLALFAIPNRENSELIWFQKNFLKQTVCFELFD